jgi:hypothetical protein
MISIALVLILIIGVNRVFKYTTDTVGTQAAFSSALRDQRGVERTMHYDFANMLPSASVDGNPAIVLRSERIYTFRNAQDFVGDDDGNPATEPDPAGGPQLDHIALDAANTPRQTARRSRIDTLSFFVRDTSTPYKRQTGSSDASATLLYQTKSDEAWVWYGHLWQADNVGNFSAATMPGAGTRTTNPNNLFGSQLKLGRRAVLLKDITTTPTLIATGENYASRSAPAGAPTGVMPPLSFGSAITASAGSFIEDGDCDLADTTVDLYRDLLETSNAWWTYLAQQVAGANAPAYRFKADPIAVKELNAAGNINSKSASRASAVLVPNCNSFTVEFAGDFLTQDAAGGVTAPAPDGTLDFVPIPGTGGAPPSRQVRWYGLPRDTGGDPVTGGLNNATPAVAANPDVLPVSVVAGSAAAAPFEQPAYAAGATVYTCAWRSSDLNSTTIGHPAFFRLIVEISDEAGRMADGQRLEYVFPAK